MLRKKIKGTDAVLASHNTILNFKAVIRQLDDILNKKNREDALHIFVWGFKKSLKTAVFQHS